MKNVIITGANGLIGTELTSLLLEQTEWNLLLLSTHEELLKEKIVHNERVRIMNPCCCNKFITNGNTEGYDSLIHLGFSRSDDPEEVSGSLDFTRSILDIARKMHVKKYINVSSQGVYGNASSPLWNEQSPVCPNSLYALGKYATEKMTELALSETDINWTNVRLSSVIENGRFCNYFVKNVVDSNPINVIGGQRKVSFIDVKDASDAFYQMLQNDELKFKPIYNLGTGKQNTIKEIASEINQTSKSYSLSPVKIIETDCSDYSDSGMDCSLFKNDFSWDFKIDLEGMIHSLYKQVL